MLLFKIETQLRQLQTRELTHEVRNLQFCLNQLKKLGFERFHMSGYSKIQKVCADPNADAKALNDALVDFCANVPKDERFRH